MRSEIGGIIFITRFRPSRNTSRDKEKMGRRGEGRREGEEQRAERLQKRRRIFRSYDPGRPNVLPAFTPLFPFYYVIIPSLAKRGGRANANGEMLGGTKKKPPARR